MRSLCVCGHTWEQHDLLDDDDSTAVCLYCRCSGYVAQTPAQHYGQSPEQDGGWFARAWLKTKIMAHLAWRFVTGK
jgi:hypothetical protein